MKILFQGDSITDAGRNRERDFSMGAGYAMLVSAALGFAHPGEYEFLNRGISGNRVVDLYARIKADILHHTPDFMSILIGVNDVWHEFEETPNGVDADKYYKIYDLLLEEVMTALPNIKIMILEPFCLKGSGTEAHWETFRSEVEKRAAMAKKLAAKYNLPFVRLQAGFDALTEQAPADYWLRDGVHPTPMGHAYIAQQWQNAFAELMKN